jgi:hypothetical protein
MLREKLLRFTSRTIPWSGDAQFEITLSEPNIIIIDIILLRRATPNLYALSFSATTISIDVQRSKIRFSTRLMIGPLIHSSGVK